MKILTLGAGALGGYFGGRLVEGGADVTFLVREGRKRQLDEHGLRIESPLGNFSAGVKTLARAEARAPVDVILLTCKSYDLASAIEAIRPAVGPETAVVPLLNGVAHIDTLNEALGARHVLGGTVRCAATLTPEGVVKHLNDWRYITFGEQTGAMSPRVAALKALFDRTSVVATAVPDVMAAMWEKLVHLATAAGATASMRANIGEIARTPDGIAFLLDLLDANGRIARAEGYPPAPKFIETFGASLRDTASTHTTSMLRDIERGGPIEADHIVGTMLAKARQHGIDARVLRTVYVHLKAYEQRRAANRL